MLPISSARNPKPKHTHTRKRIWLPFIIVFAFYGLVTLGTPPCRCGYGHIIMIQKNLIFAGLILLFFRHVIACVIKEDGKAWIFYLILTILWPGLVDLMVMLLIGSHP